MAAGARSYGSVTRRDEDRMAGRTLVTMMAMHVVVVPRFVGLRALARLGRPGSVIVDPERAELAFFVADAAPLRALPPSMVTVDRSMPLPPRGRQTPPGPYWLIAPRRGVLAVVATELAAALQEAELSPEAVG
ncbi:hypothetical protein G6541_06390 [Streptomyces albidoflavus]|nr:hypothetical protein [Streptomyces albidoflavus]